MSEMATEDKYANARRQALAQFEAIREMVRALRRATANESDDNENPFDPESPEGRAWDAGDRSSIGEDNVLSEDDARERIQENALEVCVRSGWYSLGVQNPDKAPAEFYILLCTGGPAVRIIGELSDGEPENPRLQMQDWFVEWQDVNWLALPEGARPDLLDYCRCFYFGD